MKLIGYKTYKDMDFVYIDNFYDIPLSGLCRVDNRLCAFNIDSEDDNYYNVFALSWKEQIIARFNQKMFEVCVGEHWSYPQRKNGVIYTGQRPVLEWIYYRVYNSTTRRFFKKVPK